MVSQRVSGSIKLDTADNLSARDGCNDPRGVVAAHRVPQAQSGPRTDLSALSRFVVSVRARKFPSNKGPGPGHRDGGHALGEFTSTIRQGRRYPFSCINLSSLMCYIRSRMHSSHSKSKQCLHGKRGAHSCCSHALLPDPLPPDRPDDSFGLPYLGY